MYPKRQSKGVLLQDLKKLGEAPSMDRAILIDMEDEVLVLSVAEVLGVVALSKVIGNLPKGPEHV